MNFRATYLDEPDLIFGGHKEEKDPRQGLSNFGPYHYKDEASLENIKIGIIGNQLMIDRTVEILKTLIQRDVPPEEPNKWLYPPFPGMAPNSPFRCSISFPSMFHQVLSEDYDIAKVTEIEDDNERIAYGVNLYVKKMQEFKKNDDWPHVVICALPSLIEEYCGISKRTRGAKRPKFSRSDINDQQLLDQGQSFLAQWGVNVVEKPPRRDPDKSYDFRNSLKGKVMEYDIPVQLLRQSTANYILNYSSSDKSSSGNATLPLVVEPVRPATGKTGKKKKSRQDPSSFAWNFSTALYYKANGKPWRLAKLRNDTCYVGISFFYDKLRPGNQIQISMAQVFTHSGEGLVLRGDEVVVDEHSHQAYLSKKQATDLLARALTLYTETTRVNPARVVMHKSSPFSEDEKQGFNEAIYARGRLLKDFVSIKDKAVGMNFLRTGKYPVLRGSLIRLTDNECLLYSSGFIPRLRTYPGHRIPNPLKLIHHGDSKIEEVATEILGLTKLNWNTTSFSTSLPITLAFAEGVGKVLSELSKDKEPKHHYKFYM